MPSHNSSGFNLGVSRFLYYLLVFYTLGSNTTYLSWARVPSEFWFPLGLFRLFESPDGLRNLQPWFFYVWVYTLPFCLVGLFFRILAPINFVAGFFIMNYAHSFGYLPHTQMPVLLAGLPLAFSRASDYFSFDRTFFSSKIEPSADSRSYEWAILSMQALLVCAYFAAGIAKIRNGGMEWITTDSLRDRIAHASIRYAGINQLAHRVQFNQWLYELPWLCHILAAFTIIVETSTPVLFFKRRWTWPLLPVLFVMQVAIFFAIFVNFQPYLSLYVAWINWDWLRLKFSATRTFVTRRL